LDNLCRAATIRFYCPSIAEVGFSESIAERKHLFFQRCLLAADHAVKTAALATRTRAASGRIAA
jgi:hypothetical protein